MTVASAAITLFLLMDPIGNVPAFLVVLGRLTARRRRQAIIRELLFALIILVVFLFFGHYILAALNIDPPALSMAGGIVLFLVALRMIFPRRGQGLVGSDDDSDPWFVPLCMPLIAGPAALAWVMLLASRYPDRMGDWLLALLAAWGIGGVILLASDYLRPFLKERGLRALTRLIGMILIVVSVQMLMDGVGRFLQLYGVISP